MKRDRWAGEGGWARRRIPCLKKICDVCQLGFGWRDNQFQANNSQNVRWTESEVNPEEGSQREIREKKLGRRAATGGAAPRQAKQIGTLHVTQWWRSTGKGDGWETGDIRSKRYPRSRKNKSNMRGKSEYRDAGERGGVDREQSGGSGARERARTENGSQNALPER